MSTSYSTLPAHLQAEAAAYVEHGKRPGALLMAVLDNNLRDTLEALPSGLHGDAQIALLCTLVTWAAVEAPCISRGAVEITNAWMEGGGKQGRAAARMAAEVAHKAREYARTHELNGRRHLRAVGMPAPSAPNADGAADAAADAPHSAYSFQHIADTVQRFGPLRAQ